MDQNNPVHRQARLGLKFSVRLEEISKAHGHEVKWSQSVGAEFLKCIYNFLALLTSLGRHHHSKGLFYFHVTIKCHYLVHLGMFALHMSPRLAWCYMGEDFMQKVKQLCQSAHNGTTPRLVPAK
eukprot:8919338-Alexandrium_andersonii.AAC.1